MRLVEGHMRIGGTEIYVRDVGEGPPVLLLNGIGAHVEMWRPLERALEGVRVISFDAPGTGRSETRMVPLTMHGLARLAVRLLDELEVVQADVVGYSFGGALAQEVAVQARDRLRRLVLAATFPGWGGVPGHLTAMLSLMTPLRYYSRTVYERTAGTLAGGRARYDDDFVRELWRDRSGHVPTFTGYAHQIWAAMLWSSLRWLSRVDAPTLIVIGDDDPLVPMSNALMMAARMPRARVFVGRGEGHSQLLDENSTAVRAIKQFLDAKRYEDAAPWRSGTPVDAAQVSEQLRADGLGALPWGAVSAVFRHVVG